MSFVDADLDEFELGGLLSWVFPNDVSKITHYNVYFAESMEGDSRSSLGNVTIDTNRFDVPPDIPLEAFSRLAVYASSSLVEQTTPAAVLIIEVIASVSNIAFADRDIDDAELGGWISWNAPVSYSERVEPHVV